MATTQHKRYATKKNARPVVVDERAILGVEPEDSIPDEIYPPEAMRALEIIWWATALFIFIVWAVS